ncbi:hypothetical protein UlMin_010059 [Ulmus minor]
MLDYLVVHHILLCRLIYLIDELMLSYAVLNYLVVFHVKSLRSYIHCIQGEKLNLTGLEEWMSRGKAPALEHSLSLFNIIKSRGFQIVLVSSRMENLRSSTVDNLMNVGYYGWTTLVLRGANDELNGVQDYKVNVRKELISKGYRIWGIVGDQYSSIKGLPTANRTFKFPNPLYYVS